MYHVSTLTKLVRVMMITRISSTKPKRIETILNFHLKWEVQNFSRSAYLIKEQKTNEKKKEHNYKIDDWITKKYSFLSERTQSWICKMMETLPSDRSRVESFRAQRNGGNNFFHGLIELCFEKYICF